MEETATQQASCFASCLPHQPQNAKRKSVHSAHSADAMHQSSNLQNLQQLMLLLLLVLLEQTPQIAPGHPPPAALSL
jgi:hypothetical protein